MELPLTGRQIPVIADEYVDREFGTGCVKITPAHDFNDYAVWQRHRDENPISSQPHGGLINILTVDAAIRDNEADEDFWAFRNRFRLKYPLAAGSWEIAPYLSDELFFYFNDAYDDFRSNRIKAGVTAAPVRIFVANVYYFWERGKGFALQALGGTVTFRF